MAHAASAGALAARSGRGVPARLRRRVAWAATLIVLVLGALFVAAWCVGSWLEAPARGTVGAPPSDLAAERVVIASRDGRVAGWFVAGTPGHGAVLLLHGLRSDRRQMLGRARFLHAAGHAVLLVDLPAHGESDGARIAFGWHEAAAVQAAVAWLRERLPGEAVGAIGVSLGAAALVYAAAEMPPLQAVVLESMYPSIAAAAHRRVALRAGPFADVLTPLLLWQLPWRTGVEAATLRPEARLAALRAPLLVAGGAADLRTTAAETTGLHAAAPAPKSLWLVPDAAHVDLHAHDAAAYRMRIAPFLAEHLRAPRDDARRAGPP